MLRELGWTQNRLAAEVSGHYVTVSRWATGVQPIPPAVLLWLRLVLLRRKEQAAHAAELEAQRLIAERAQERLLEWRRRALAAERALAESGPGSPNLRRTPQDEPVPG
ncbi:MAG: hypothetical protein KC492_35465 [Myxococcales bacterium]|nr:hypothetical protein [Myxococcales bacterium]